MEDFERAFWATRLAIWAGVGALPGAILMPFVFYRKVRDPILGTLIGFLLGAVAGIGVGVIATQIFPEIAETGRTLMAEATTALLNGVVGSGVVLIAAWIMLPTGGQRLNQIERRQNLLIAEMLVLFFFMGILLILAGGLRVSIEFREITGVNPDQMKEALGDSFAALPVLVLASFMMLVGYGLIWGVMALGAREAPAWHAGRNGLMAVILILVMVGTGLVTTLRPGWLWYAIPPLAILGAVILWMLVRFTQPDFRLALGAERIRRRRSRYRWIVTALLIIAISTLTALGVVHAVLTDAIELPLPDVAPGELLYLTTFDGYNDEWDEGEIVTDETGNQRLEISIDLVTNINEESLFSLLDRKFRDFDMRVTLTQLESDPTHDNEIGVIFRYRSNEEYYLFKISGDGYYRLLKISPDSDDEDEDADVETISTWIPTTTITANDPPYSTLIRPGRHNEIQSPLDATNEIRIIGRGDKFWFYVNGEPLLLCLRGLRGNSMWVANESACVEGNIATYIFQDDDYKQGQIGLSVAYSPSSDTNFPITVAFDNVVVVGPPSRITVPNIEGVSPP